MVETVLNLITHEPGFLASQHFQQSLSSEVVALDQTFLVEVRGRPPPRARHFLAAAASCAMRCCMQVDLTCMTLWVMARPGCRLVHVGHQAADWLPLPLP